MWRRASVAVLCVAACKGPPPVAVATLPKQDQPAAAVATPLVPLTASNVASWERLLGVHESVEGARFLANGSLAVSTPDAIVIVARDGRTHEVRADRLLAASPSGKLALFRDEAIVVLGPDGAEVAHIAAGASPPIGGGVSGFFDPDEKLAVGLDDQVVHVFDVALGREIRRVEVATDQAQALLPSSGALAAGPSIGVVGLEALGHDAPSVRITYGVPRTETDGWVHIDRIDPSPDGSSLAVHDDFGVVLLDVKSRRSVGRWEGTLMEGAWVGERLAVMGSNDLLLVDPRDAKHVEKHAVPAPACLSATSAGCSGGLRWSEIRKTDRGLSALAVGGPEAVWVAVWREGQPLRATVLSDASWSRFAGGALPSPNVLLSPDGRSVVSFLGTPPRLLAVPDDPAAPWPSRDLPADARAGEFSPDGAELALWSSMHYWLLDAATLKPVAQADRVTSPRFADGSPLSWSALPSDARERLLGMEVTARLGEQFQSQPHLTRWLLWGSAGASWIDPRSMRVAWSLPPSRYNAASVSPSGASVALSIEGARVEIWNTMTGRKRPSPNAGAVDEVDLPDDQHLVTRAAAIVESWSGPDREWRAECDAGHARAHLIVFRGADRVDRVAVGGGEYCLLDGRTGRRVALLHGGGSDDGKSPDGREMYSIDVAGKLHRWSTADGAELASIDVWPLHRPTRGEASGSNVAYSADGKRVVVAGSRGVRVHDRGSGALVRELSREGAYDVALGPDGAVAAAGPHGVAVWDQEGKPLKRFACHGADVLWSADGRVLWCEDLSMRPPAGHNMAEKVWVARAVAGSNAK